MFAITLIFPRDKNGHEQMDVRFVPALPRIGDMLCLDGADQQEETWQVRDVVFYWPDDIPDNLQIRVTLK